MRRYLKRAAGIWAAVLCACVLAAGGALPRVFALSASAARTTDYLNLRAGAGTGTKVILTLGRNVAVTVLDNSNPQWAKVRTASGKEGYCFKQYLSFSGQAPVSPAAGAGTALTTANLNLRQGPSLGSAVDSVLPRGTSLTVLDDSNPQWTRVQAPGGRQGWCSAQYLKTAAPAQQAAGSSSSGLTATTTDYLNLRQGAGMNYPVILTLARGASASVLDNSNSGWVQVRTQSGREGWCSRQYLKLSGGTPSAGEDPASQTGGAAVTGAKVTADLLRLREQASTSSRILGNLPNGTVLKVLDASQSGWVKVETPGGQTGYVSAQYVTLMNGSETVPSAGGAVTLSSVSASLPAGKTLYLKASPGSGLAWASSNAAVASVANGFVTAKAPGTAQITASSSGGSAACSVTVTAAEPVRTAYASPNVASPGGAVTFVAVTDARRDGVRFSVRFPDGQSRTVAAAGCTAQTTDGVATKVWKGTAVLPSAGLYSFTAFSSEGGAFSGTGFSSDVLVATQAGGSATTAEQRRASDKMLNLIARWEGYSAAVYDDELASSRIPTVGYGCTYGANAVFYNNLSQTEAWSLLVNRINRSSYTSELNRMIANNRFRMSQNQADCLLSFAYNVGSGYFNGAQEMDFRRIMKNAVVPPAIPAGGSVRATVTMDAALHGDRSNSSAGLEDVSSGTPVDVTGSDFSDTKNGWYQVRLPDGKTGWLNSGYVSLADSDSLVHDLNYTNAYAFGTELIRWNQAGGRFYAGLFYRRLGEANVYNYGDYDAVRYNKYGYAYPPSASSLS